MHRARQQAAMQPTQVNDVYLLLMRRHAEQIEQLKSVVAVTLVSLALLLYRRRD
jgi:hypothetical protein